MNIKAVSVWYSTKHSILYTGLRYTRRRRHRESTPNILEYILVYAETSNSEHRAICLYSFFSFCLFRVVKHLVRYANRCFDANETLTVIALPYLTETIERININKHRHRPCLQQPRFPCWKRAYMLKVRTSV